MAKQEDWTKFVTLNPPNEVRFKLIDDLKESMVVVDGQAPKAVARIQIINKSKTPIIFRLKTTEIKNYRVMPNAEVLPSEHFISVKIVTTLPISQATKDLVNDSFLVQLAKLGPEMKQKLTNEEISDLWKKMDKSKQIQYKLKVKLNQDVIDHIGGLGAGPEQSRQSEIYQQVKNKVQDMALKDDRDVKEESKERTPSAAPMPTSG